MENLSLSALLDVSGEVFLDEISIVVSNMKEYLYYLPSKRVDLKIRPGDPVKEGTIAQKAISQKQKVSEFINRDVFGVPYHGMAEGFSGTHKNTFQEFEYLLPRESFVR